MSNCSKGSSVQCEHPQNPADFSRATQMHKASGQVSVKAKLSTSSCLGQNVFSRLSFIPYHLLRMLHGNGTRKIIKISRNKARLEGGSLSALIF